MLHKLPHLCLQLWRQLLHLFQLSVRLSLQSQPQLRLRQALSLRSMLLPSFAKTSNDASIIIRLLLLSVLI
ncbi:hypothetical protein RND81_10G193500 [Saponaria officinalis]|uniref:Uncharacterized protein n=1 Tax=Saponaria officinalis TaxID=3572 RepID=A0AAW1I6H3_SAPOF